MHVSVHKNDVCRAGRRVGGGVQWGTSGQICSPIIPDSLDTLGVVRQREKSGGSQDLQISAHLQPPLAERRPYLREDGVEMTPGHGPQPPFICVR